MFDYIEALDDALAAIYRDIDARCAAFLLGQQPPAPKHPRAPYKRRERPIESSPFAEKIQRAMSYLIRAENRKQAEWGRLSNADLSMMRTLGVYLIEDDFAQFNNEPCLALKIDPTLGIPSVSYVMVDRLSHQHKPTDDADYGIMRVQETTQLPVGYFPGGPGFPYELHVLFGFKKAMGLQWYFTIDNAGRIYPAWVPATEVSMIRVRRGDHRFRGPHRLTQRAYKQFIEFPSDEDAKLRWTTAQVMACAISAWQLMHTAPVVEVTDGDRRLVVSVSMDRIKELLSRRNGATYNGPSLHWVSSHLRSSGGAVRTHLRGTTKIQFAGFDLTINMPGEAVHARSKIAKGKLRPMTNDHGLWRSRATHITHNPIIAAILGSRDLVYMPNKEYDRMEAEEASMPIPDITTYVVPTEKMPLRVYYKHTQ